MRYLSPKRKGVCPRRTDSRATRWDQRWSWRIPSSECHQSPPMMPPPPPRARVTQPQRRFTPNDLAELPRGDRRKLIQLLLTESGSRVVEFQAPAAYDELVLETRPLWRPRRVRVRIADQPVDQGDVDRLAEAVAANGDAEGMLLTCLGVNAQLHAPPAVMVVEPAELIARMERCSVIAWPNRRPVPAYDRLSVQRSLDHDAFLLDPVGLRWLPSLALNELPAELSGRDLGPETLFERMAFRLLTSTLRFGGSRYGEAARGQRLPDAVVSWPGSSRLVALLDCKATADGYVMDSDHYLRFVGYVTNLRAGLEADGDELRYLIVLSSSFTGSPGLRHPFHQRASALLDETGVRLVYVRAADLARAAAVIESRGMAPGDRDELDWSTVFDQGLVESAHLEEMLEA
jgi:hypothetical protein